MAIGFGYLALDLGIGLVYESYLLSLVLYAGRRVTFVGRREHERLGELATRPGRLLVVAPDTPSAVGGAS